MGLSLRRALSWYALGVRAPSFGCIWTAPGPSGIRGARLLEGRRSGWGWCATPDPAGARPAGRPGPDLSGVAVKGIEYRYICRPAPRYARG
jgi:hypothetical protein